MLSQAEKNFVPEIRVPVLRWVISNSELCLQIALSDRAAGNRIAVHRHVTRLSPSRLANLLFIFCTKCVWPSTEQGIKELDKTDLQARQTERKSLKWFCGFLGKTSEEMYPLPPGQRKERNFTGRRRDNIRRRSDLISWTSVSRSSTIRKKKERLPIYLDREINELTIELEQRARLRGCQAVTKPVLPNGFSSVIFSSSSAWSLTVGRYSVHSFALVASQLVSFQ